MTDVFAVAKYLVRRPFNQQHEEQIDPLCHLRLQKLLYYAQGWSLALLDAPLFKSTLQAWTHGPVSPEIYQVLREKSWHPICPEEMPAAQEVTELEQALLEMVWSEYGKFSPTYLKELTHQEPPWQKARGNLPTNAKSNAEILPADMRAHFEYESLRRASEIGDPKTIWQAFARSLQGRPKRNLAQIRQRKLTTTGGQHG